jgi:cyclopropane-fatty-acyl-phospholipid synthase
MVHQQKKSLCNGNALPKNIIFKLLSQIKQGSIALHDPEGRYVFGDEEDVYGERATINIINPQAYKKILLLGSVGAGKSYIDGDWHSDNLEKLIELFIKNEGLLTRIEGPLARLVGALRTFSYKININNISRAKDNILAHYDLGNDFFQLILDPSMMYSCALYEPAHIGLDEAAKKKLQKICTQLDLKPSDHVLEIGTGWGGFAVYAAQEYGCKITTTTISDKQHAYVKQKIKNLGLEHQIELLNCDYRKLSGQYDKVVSIEMIEAVGHKYFDVFFQQCNQLIKPEGLFLLQAIVINDQAYETAKNEVDFIKRYIFPGGCLPSVCAIANSIARKTTLQMISLTDIGRHYVTTLNDWHRQLLSNKPIILSQGFTDQFIRMWEFYFCYSAAGFASKYISVIHGVWQKRR